MPLPQYLPVELALQNFARGLAQWKLCHAAHETTPNEGTKKQLAEAAIQLDQRNNELRRALAKPLET